MEYLTAYHWQEGGGCTLLLQQYVCRQTPVCFACLCTGQGADGGMRCRDAAERLREWCRTTPWQRAARRPAAWMGRLGRELGELLEECGGPRPDGGMSRAVLLGIGPEILALGGGQNLWLLHTAFGRGRAVLLPGQFSGLLEPGAGLLLATDAFIGKLEKERLEEALRPSEIRTQRQAERRLRELAVSGGRGGAGGGAGEGQAAGEEAGAAVLLIGKEAGGVY